MSLGYFQNPQTGAWKYEHSYNLPDDWIPGTLEDKFSSGSPVRPRTEAELKAEAKTWRPSPNFDGGKPPAYLLPYLQARNRIEHNPYQNYENFFNEPRGTTKNFAGGSVTNRGGGTAIFTDSEGRKHTLRRSTPLSRLAQQNPDIGNELSNLSGSQWFNLSGKENTLPDIRVKGPPREPRGAPIQGWTPPPTPGMRVKGPPREPRGAPIQGWTPPHTPGLPYQSPPIPVPGWPPGGNVSTPPRTEDTLEWPGHLPPPYQTAPPGWTPPPGGTPGQPSYNLPINGPGMVAPMGSRFLNPSSGIRPPQRPPGFSPNIGTPSYSRPIPAPPQRGVSLPGVGFGMMNRGYNPSQTRNPMAPRPLTGILPQGAPTTQPGTPTTQGMLEPLAGTASMGNQLNAGGNANTPFNTSGMLMALIRDIMKRR